MLIFPTTCVFGANVNGKLIWILKYFDVRKLEFLGYYAAMIALFWHMIDRMLVSRRSALLRYADIRDKS